MMLMALFLALGSPAADSAVLHQGAFNPGSMQYEYGYRSAPKVSIMKAPTDADWNRWGMMHDGRSSRLLVFKKGSRSVLYQFTFNPERSAFEYGFGGISEVRIEGVPNDTDVSRLMLLHDSKQARLFMSRKNFPDSLYHFRRRDSRGVFQLDSRKPLVPVLGMPKDIDWKQLAMLHDGSFMRFYGVSGGRLYQAAWDAKKSAFVYGFRSIPKLRVTGMPKQSMMRGFSMLHDGKYFRLYGLVD